MGCDNFNAGSFRKTKNSKGSKELHSSHGYSKVRIDYNRRRSFLKFSPYSTKENEKQDINEIKPASHKVAREILLKLPKGMLLQQFAQQILWMH